MTDTYDFAFSGKFADGSRLTGTLALAFDSMTASGTIVAGQKTFDVQSIALANQTYTVLARTTLGTDFEDVSLSFVASQLNAFSGGYAESGLVNAQTGVVSLSRHTSLTVSSIQAKPAYPTVRYGGAFNVDGSQGPQTLIGTGSVNFINTATAAGTGPLQIDLAAGTLQKGGVLDANLSGINGVQLGADASVVLGASSGTDLIYGGAGADSVYNQGGTDYIQGGTGSNTVVGGAGISIFYGNGGTDTMLGGTAQSFMRAGPTASSSDTFYGNGGTDFVYGGAGTTTLYGASGTEVLTGGSGTSTLIGSTQSTAALNIVNGGSGTDLFYGGVGVNILYEGTGTDVLGGNAGTDLVYGGIGHSFIYGGSGTDVVTTGAGNQYVKAGTGKTFFNDTAVNLTAGRFDQIDNFAGGQGTNLYLPSAVQAQTSFVGQNGGTAVLTTVGQGTAESFVSNTSIAAVQANTHFTL